MRGFYFSCGFKQSVIFYCYLTYFIIAANAEKLWLKNVIYADVFSEPLGCGSPVFSIPSPAIYYWNDFIKNV